MMTTTDKLPHNHAEVPPCWIAGLGELDAEIDRAERLVRLAKECQLPDAVAAMRLDIDGLALRLGALLMLAEPAERHEIDQRIRRLRGLLMEALS